MEVRLVASVVAAALPAAAAALPAAVVDLDRGAVAATRAADWRQPLILAREGPLWLR